MFASGLLEDVSNVCLSCLHLVLTRDDCGEHGWTSAVFRVALQQPRLQLWMSELQMLRSYVNHAAAYLTRINCNIKLDISLRCHVILAILPIAIYVIKQRQAMPV